MNERWENVIEQEINFYINFKKYEMEIHELLRENELNIQYPVTKFDYVEGRIYRACPGTEAQALHRIEVRDSLQSLLDRAKKRINRFIKAFNKLNEKEQDLIYFTYFDQMYKDFELTKVLEFRTIKDLQLAKIQVIKKLFEIYTAERSEKHKEFIKMLKEERDRKAKRLRNLLEIAQ